MEVKKRSGEKRGGLKLGGLGGGGGFGLAVVVGGALVAATVWSFSEFRRRRKPSCKNGTLKDFQKLNLEKVKNVDEGGDGVGVILQNSKLRTDVDESQTEEKDSSAINLLLDVEKRLKLGIIEEEEEEEIQEGMKIEDDESINRNMALFQKEDDVACEAVSVHETMHEGIKFCVNSVDTDTSLSVSEDDLSASDDEVTESQNDRIVVEEKVEVAQFATLESFVDDGITCQQIGDKIVQLMTSNVPVDDGNNDAVSEDLEYEAEDGSEGSSRGTSDSSSESNAEAVWQVKSSEALSQSIKGEVGSEGCSRGTSDSSTESIAEAAWPMESLEALSQAIEEEKNLTSIQNEIVEADDSEKMSSANVIYHKNSYDDNVSINKKGQVSTAEIQMVGHSTNARIWVTTVLVALLVLLGALLTQHKYFSSALADHVSSLNAFLMK